MRAKVGQFLFKDQTLLFAFLTFWWQTENYARAVVIVFCLHCLTPLEVELFELTEALGASLLWAHCAILPPLLLVSIASGLGLLLNMSLNWGKRALQVFLACGVVLLLAWSFV